MSFFNAPSRTRLTTLVSLAIGALSAPAAWGQQDSIKSPDMWWKGLFRPANTVNSADCEATEATAVKVESGTVNAAESEGDTTLVLPHTPTERHAPATFEWILPERLAHLDSLDKADPKPLEGYRIQIYFGELQEARAVRAAFRRDHPDVACQLLPITPNYAVTVGNFRDMWSAQRALRDGEVGTWRHALVIPSTIDLPTLQ
ncbi:MAG: hypothetical protein ACPG66_00960 [Flavobacteriales bacterium]